MSYTQAFRVLREYSKDRKIVISFDDINLAFYDDYVNYLRGRDYAENTIGGYIKHLKTFMNEAFDRKLTTNLEFKSQRFKKPQETTEKRYLNLKEVEKIYSLDLSIDKALERTLIHLAKSLNMSVLATTHFL